MEGGREIRFLEFATSAQATWPANFRDLRAAVTRMATLAPAGRIRSEDVEREIARLLQSWRAAAPADAAEEILREALGEEQAAALDRFDKVQLAEVIRVARGAPSLSEAGRQLFAVSRLSRKSTNDADRLRKYLAQYGLSWTDLQTTEHCLPGRL